MRPSPILLAEPLDPSWLPSTAAQSAAALVAIVGGFLINRLVGLDAEQGQARRRVREAQERLDYAAQVEQSRWSDFVTHEACTWLGSYDVAVAIAGSEGTISLADLLSQSEEAPSDLSEADIEPYYVEALKVFREAREQYRTLVPESEKQAAWDNFRREHQVKSDRWEHLLEATYASVALDASRAAKKKREAMEAMEPAMKVFNAARLLSAFPNIDTSAYRGLGFSALRFPVSAAAPQLRSRFTEAHEDRLRAEGELASARRANDWREARTGIYATLGVLTVFALVGIVLPFTVLWHTPAGPMEWRSVAGWGFAGGVVLFLGYMWSYAWLLLHRSPIVEMESVSASQADQSTEEP